MTDVNGRWVAMKISKRKALTADSKAEAELQRVLNDYLCGERSFEGVLAAVDKLAADKARGQDALAALVEEKCRQLDIPAEIKQSMLGRLGSEQPISTATLISDTKRMDLRLDNTLGRAEAEAYVAAAGTGDSPSERGASEDRLPVPVMQAGGDQGPDLPRPGAVLNHRYELIRCVGAGGSSNVYKALDRRKLLFDDPFPYVAIKVLNQRFRSRPDWPEALRREAARCQQLTCPNIVKVHDVLKDGGTVYIVMEYLSGAPLTQTIRTEEFKGLPAEQAADIINAMGRALAYAHDQGIVHCDFKPANIFVTQDGEIKLIDFGIARVMNEDEEIPSSRSLELFEQNAVTPAYASPELLERNDPDPRDDIYSLACTAYELLTGSHPYAYKPATVAREEKMAVPRHRALTRQQWKALQRALALTRSDRTPSISQFLAAFNGVPQLKPWYLQAAALVLAVTGVVWLYTKVSGSEGLKQSTAAVIASFKEKSDQMLTAVRTPASAKPTVDNTGQDTTKTVAQNSGSDVSAPGSTRDTVASAGTLVPAITAKGEPLAQPVDATSQDKHPAMTASRTQDSAVQTVDTAARDPLAEPQAIVAEQAKPEDQTAAAVASLLARAEQQRSASNWVRPEDDSALDSYREVLKLEPDNSSARAGIDSMRAAYMQAIRTALDQGDTSAARHNLTDVNRIASGDAEVNRLSRELQMLASRAEQSDVQKSGDADRKSHSNAQARPAAVAVKATPSVKEPVTVQVSGASGLEAIADRLKERALVKQRQGALSESQALVAEGLRVQPEHAGLLRLRQAIEHQQQNEAAQKAETGFAAAAVSAQPGDDGARSSVGAQPTAVRDANLNFGTF